MNHIGLQNWTTMYVIYTKSQTTLQNLTIRQNKVSATSLNRGVFEQAITTYEHYKS